VDPQKPEVYLQGVHPLKLFARRFFSLINPTHNFKLELQKWGSCGRSDMDLRCCSRACLIAIKKSVGGREGPKFIEAVFGIAISDDLGAKPIGRSVACKIQRKNGSL